MVNYREFLPEPPGNCRDPELFRLLNEFAFVRWHPDCEARKRETLPEIFSEPVLLWAEAALRDPSGLLRSYCGELLVWV